MIAAPTPLCRPKVERSRGVTTITLAEGPFSGSGNRIAQQPQGLTDQTGRGALVLDFRNVESLNSSEIATLIGLHRKVTASGGRLTLCNVPPHLYEVFERTRLDRWLDVRRGQPSGAASVT
jgi:anti-anti-sigma factor